MYHGKGIQQQIPSLGITCFCRFQKLSHTPSGLGYSLTAQLFKKYRHSNLTKTIPELQCGCKLASISYKRKYFKNTSTWRSLILKHNKMFSQESDMGKLWQPQIVQMP